jgi:Fe-S cluster biogenesis protein NfuA/nitrite reductase/ring-hydroxylating ferredoxin subunit
VARPEQADHPPLDLQAAGDRIEALLVASAAGGAIARERSEELVRIVADLYGAGIERILDILHGMGRLDDDVLAALAADSTVSSLLLVHGLHPYDITTRVENALDSVRPYLGSHGGDVELLEVTDDGVVRLRLLGSCDGCPSSSVTLTLAVEGAVEAAAPEVTSIEVEPASPTATATAAGPVISIDSLRSRIDEPAPVQGAAWETVPELADLAPGSVAHHLVNGTSVLACRVGADLYAFRDRCARGDHPLAGATVARRLGGAAGDAVLVCPACRAHYDVRRAGASLDDDGRQLDPFPLLQRGGAVSVAVPASVTA